MDLFTTQQGINDVLLRWIHIGAGITWIGLLYYFNFVQAPFMNEVEPEVKGAATRRLVPRALLWFRYAALLTFLAGATIIIIKIAESGVDLLGGTYGTLILAGMILGTIMFLNVWGVIWPKQKIVIASAEATATGGQADPATADSARRALLASRTNVLFSLPMLFFMISAAHGSNLFGEATTGAKTIFWVVFAVLTAGIELNSLAGLTGGLKKPLEKVGTVLWSGVALLAVFLILLIVLWEA